MTQIACPRCMPPGDPCCPYCCGTYGVELTEDVAHGLMAATAPILQALRQAAPFEETEPDWNGDYGLEITVRVDEARALVGAVKAASGVVGEPEELPPEVLINTEVRKLREALEVVCCLTARSEHPDDCACDMCQAWNTADGALHP